MSKRNLPTLIIFLAQISTSSKSGADFRSSTMIGKMVWVFRVFLISTKKSSSRVRISLLSFYNWQSQQIVLRTFFRGHRRRLGRCPIPPVFWVSTRLSSRGLMRREKSQLIVEVNTNRRVPVSCLQRPITNHERTVRQESQTSKTKCQQSGIRKSNANIWRCTKGSIRGRHGRSVYHRAGTAKEKVHVTFCWMGDPCPDPRRHGNIFIQDP